MTIGIGVTSYNRPEHLKLWEEQTIGYTCSQAYSAENGGMIGVDYNHNTVLIYPAKNIEGIAQAKNNCLRALKNCDYIFLFDDDCFPKKDGWIDFFIDAHKASGQHHFIYLKETNIIKKINNWTDFVQKKQTVIESFNNCAGCFMFLTKEVINKVGAFNPAYKTYGFEHAGYSNRIHMAGLTPFGKYLCPAGASQYIHSLDLDGVGDYEINHYPSLVNKISEIDSYINYNRRIFDADNQIYIPL